MFLVLAFAAIALGAAAAPRSAFGGLEYRTVIIWLSVPLILTLASQQFFIILVFLLLLIFAAPASALDRVKLFALIVPAAPLYLHTVISLPGISYFLSLDFYKCAVLVLLIPAIFLKLKERDDVAPWSIVDICVILYTVYTSFQLMMSLGVIGGARSMVSQVLVYTLPYFAIRWVVSNEKDVRPVFAGFVVAACMLAFIALISAWKQWDFYRMARFDELGGFVELRDGRLRIQATLNTHSLGYTLLLGLFLLQYAKSYISIGFLRLWGLRGLLLLAAFAPASKGALAGFALGCVVYVVLSIRSSALRWVLGLCVSIGGGHNRLPADVWRRC